MATLRVKSPDLDQEDTAKNLERVVSELVAETVAQANVLVLGSGPAVTIAQSGLSFAQSQGILFANMVNNQYQQSVMNNTALGKGVTQLLDQNAGSTVAVNLPSLMSYIKAHSKEKDGDLAYF